MYNGNPTKRIQRRPYWPSGGIIVPSRTGFFPGYLFVFHTERQFQSADPDLSWQDTQ